MAATWLDNAVTAIANPEALEQTRIQDENDAQLKARWESILRRTDLTPLQRLNAQREYARLGGIIDNWDDIAEDNSQIFATEYVATVKKTTNAVVSGLTDIIPWKIWLFAGFAVVVLFFFKFGGTK